MQHTINIKNMAYDPDTLTVAVGDTVVWQNNDNMAHTASRDEDPGAFDTDRIAGGAASQPITFSEASGADGFVYVCHYHEDMMAKIVVNA